MILFQEDNEHNIKENQKSHSANPLSAVEDRSYSATVGSYVGFTHFLLTPDSSASGSAADVAFTTNVKEDGQFTAGSDSKVLDIDFDGCESAVRPMFAAQCSLKSMTIRILSATVAML